MKHVSNDGQVRDCEATVGKCPLEHFETEAEAQASIESRHTPVITKRHEQVKLDSRVKKAVATLSEVGQPYVVGGAVRDSFFNAENKDIDIEVHNSDLDAITEKLRQNGYTVDEVGKSFGVLKVSGNGVRDLDVSVPRRENRIGSGHRDFSVDLSPMSTAEAAERRDFTFNAIMYDPNSKKIVDPANGQSDLQNGVLRHVSEKFSEDPLRVMRGFQMASRFNMQYDPKTASLCKSIRGEYDSLSVERLREEWGKFYTKSLNPQAGIKALQDSGWDDTEPGLKNALKDRATIESLQRLPHAPKANRESIGLAVTTRSMSPEDRNVFLERMSSNKNEKKAALGYLQAENSRLESDRDVLWQAQQKGFKFSSFEHYSKITSNKQGVDAAHRARKLGVLDGPEKDFARGDEIAAAANRKPGPWMNDAISTLREHQYSRDVTTKEEYLRLAKRLFE